MTDNAGQLKYPQFFTLVKCVLSISHGNSAPERGFSIKTDLHSVPGDSTSNDIITSLCLVTLSRLVNTEFPTGVESMWGALENLIGRLESIHGGGV